MQTIADYPAYRIYKPYEGRRFKHGDVIALPHDTKTHGRQWTFYTLGTVEGYAINYGECPHEMLQRHLKYAEEMRDGRVRYWANQNAVSISSMKGAKKAVPGFDWGDVIILQGHRFRLDHAPNNNCTLTPVE